MVFCMAALASCLKVVFFKSALNHFFVSSFYSLLKTVLACVVVVLNSVVSKNMVGYCSKKTYVVKKFMHIEMG